MGFGQNLGKIWAGKMRFIPPFKTLSYFHFHITSRPEEPLPLILTEPVPEVFEFVPLIGQIFFMLLMVNQWRGPPGRLCRLLHEVLFRTWSKLPTENIASSRLAVPGSPGMSVKLATSAVQRYSGRISWRWPIHSINSVDKTKLSCNTPHHCSTTDSFLVLALFPPQQCWVTRSRERFVHQFSRVFYYAIF